MNFDKESKSDFFLGGGGGGGGGVGEGGGQGPLFCSKYINQLYHPNQKLQIAKYFILSKVYTDEGGIK